MSGKVKCTCGWSWNKSDSSKKDMYICHECGRDNSNNMKNGGWLDKHAEIPQAQEGEDISNLMQEGIDSVQSIYRNYGPPTMFGKLPFNLGAGLGLLQSHVNDEPEKLSDQLGVFPNPYMQAASYTMLMAEKEKENMQEYARKKYKGKDLTELVPEQEINNKVIDNTYVPKPKIGKIKETKKENKTQSTPYKEKKEVNEVEIDNTRTNKPRVDTNYKPKSKPETKYKFTTPNISYRNDSFVMPKEVNDIKIDNTRVEKPKILKKQNGGWLDNYGEEDNYNDYNVSAPEGFKGDGYSNVGRNSSPAWGGQFKEGGEIPNAQKEKKVKPIYVESKNDPRYKAYQDSLSLYNNYNTVKKELNKAEYTKQYSSPIDGKEQTGLINAGLRLLGKDTKTKAWKTYVNDVEKEQAYKQKGNLRETSDFIRGVINPNLPYQLYSSTITPIGTENYQFFNRKLHKAVRDGKYTKEEAAKIAKNDPRTGDARVIANYSNVKPKQQVIVKDNNAPQYKTIHTGEGEGRFEPIQRPSVHSIENNLRPAGLVQPDFELEADVDIHNRARIPKYYDVIDKVNQNFGGSETQYKYYPENGDLPDVAPSPYNTRTVTPHYQMGGSVYPVNYVPEAQMGTKIIAESTGVYKKPFNNKELKNIIKDETERIRKGDIKNPKAEANKIEKSLPTKETVDFFNKIKKEWGPEYFTALLKVQNKRGNPSVNVGTDKGLPFHARRNYNPFTNEVNIPKGLESSNNIYNYLTEVSHASQPLSEVIPRFLTNDIPGYIKSYISSGDIEDNIEKNVYNNPNTVENYTHEKIEPSLINDVENYTSWPTSKEEEEEEYKLIEDQLKRGNKNLQMGGVLPGAVGHMYARHGAPSKGPHRNQTDKTDASAQNGKEMQYYQQGLDWKPKTISRDGSVIKDDRGQWDHPGEITEIGSNKITMQGVPYDVLGISDTGDVKLMKPGKNYKFKGKKVTEYPMAQDGIKQELNTVAKDNTSVYNKERKKDKLIVPGTPVVPVTHGNWLNKLITENITPYGYLLGNPSTMIPNKQADDIAWETKQKFKNLDTKYGYERKVERSNEMYQPHNIKENFENINNPISYKKESKKIIQERNKKLLAITKNVSDNKLSGKLKGSPRPERLNASQDALNLNQGVPQKYNSFVYSNYKPSNSKEDSQYYSLAPQYEDEIRQDLFERRNADFINSKDKFRQVKGSHIADASLKDYQYSKGKDEKGDYIAYYDVNDYGNILDILPNSNPFEIYGRIYYDKKTGKPISKQKNGGEFPMAKNGRRQEQKGLQNLDNLTNFTNYNTKQPGGWLDTL